MKIFFRKFWDIITFKKIRSFVSDYRIRRRVEKPWLYYYIDKETGEKVRHPLWTRFIIFCNPWIAKHFWDDDGFDPWGDFMNKKDDDDYGF